MDTISHFLSEGKMGWSDAYGKSIITSGNTKYVLYHYTSYSYLNILPDRSLNQHEPIGVLTVSEFKVGRGG